MTTKKFVSYQRNRSYKKEFDWTYDQNCNYDQINNCYNKAKANPATRYMKRMKQNQDITLPELLYLSDKNPRNQASRIFKIKTARENNFATDIYTNLNCHSDTNDIRRNEFVNKNINLLNDTPTNINERNVENNQMRFPEYKTLKETLKPIFSQMIASSDNKNIDERKHLTKINTKINDTLLKCVDDLRKEYVTTLMSINYGIYKCVLILCRYDTDVYKLRDI